MNLLTGKNQISQEAMETYLQLDANKKQIEKDITELKEQLINALESGIKPSKGKLTCQVEVTERRTPKYKEELAIRISKAEMDAIIANTAPSISKSVKIKLSPTN